jgi:endonuclease/exonuclease/phosphatase family metal-dependent hydrolase
VEAAGVCAELGADVIALQEVDRSARRSGRVDEAALIAEACGMHHVFAPAHRLGLRGRYGNALLSRTAIEDVEILPLPRPARAEPRVALLASTAGLSVAVTHLGRDRAESAAQLSVVLTSISARPTPRVVLGDLNRRDHEVTALETEGFDVVGGGPTYPADAPTLRIDHVAVDGLTVTSVDIPETTVSDHRPLVVDVEVVRDGEG